MVKTMTTFIHSADWQLGMTWARLSPEAQARFTGDRIRTIRHLPQVVPAADFMVVAGDVFENDHLSEHDIGRALSAMGDTGLDIYLLPGNHDPYRPGSLWFRREFTSHKPDNVHVLVEPVVHGDTEIVPAPWLTKNPDTDPTTALLAQLGEKTTQFRVVVGHGMVDALQPDATKDPLRLAVLRDAIDAGLVDYVALGDRHIAWVDEVSGAIAYSGTHEVTDLRERSKGTILEVSLGPVEVTKHVVGTWEFVDIAHHLESADDIDTLTRLLDRPGTDTTVIRTALSGHLSLAENAQLEALLDSKRPLFAALYPWDRNTTLVTLPDEADLDALGLTGFAADALAQLHDEADTNETAHDALKLLYRLASS